jgi:antitoxin ChpS
LIIEPQRKRRYTLDELLAQCDPNAAITGEERHWLNAPAKGDEII